MLASKFHTHTKRQAKLQFCNFWIANWKTRDSAPNDSKLSKSLLSHSQAGKAKNGQELHYQAPKIINQHLKMLRLSAPRTGHLYHPGNIPGSHFCWRLSQPQGHSAAGKIIIIIIIGIQPLGRSGQRPEFNQATGMTQVRCILGKFLGVACHCFPLLFRCSHFSPPGASTSTTT
jgi:hypothetical protein